MLHDEICPGCEKPMIPVFDFPDFKRSTKYACTTPACKFNVFEIWKYDVEKGTKAIYEYLKHGGEHKGNIN